VAVSPGGLAVAGADRDTVSGLAGDSTPGMVSDGIDTDQDGGLIRRDLGKDEATRLVIHPVGKPLGGGEDSLVGGHMPLGLRGGCPEQVGDAVSPGGKDSRAEKAHDVMECWLSGHGRGSMINDRSSADRIMEGRPRLAIQGVYARPHAAATLALVNCTFCAKNDLNMELCSKNPGNSQQFLDGISNKFRRVITHVERTPEVDPRPFLTAARV
jgi:hypothetical protein